MTLNNTCFRLGAYRGDRYLIMTSDCIFFAKFVDCSKNKYNVFASVRIFLCFFKCGSQKTFFSRCLNYHKLTGREYT